MRLYTIKTGTEEGVAVQKAEGAIIPLKTLGISVGDMNELIDRYDELKDSIKDKYDRYVINENDESDYKIIAPIPVPKQDILCLGVNYREHIEETVDVLDFTKKKDAVYFSKRVNRANDPDGDIPFYNNLARKPLPTHVGCGMNRFFVLS